MYIPPGFVGCAIIDNKLIRCNDFNVNVRQEPLFYDHTIGLRDTISDPPSIYTIKGDGGDKAIGETYNKQKMLWRPSVKIAQGGFSFPWTDNYPATLLEEARGGKSFDMDFRYSCGLARRFTGCKINSYSVKIANGDIVSSSSDIMAIHEEMLSDPSTSFPNTTIEKLITWDAVDVKIDDEESIPLSSLEFTINNNCIPIYTAGRNMQSTDSLEAKEIRVGMQQLTGVMTYYIQDSLDFLEYETNSKKITITVNYDGSNSVIIELTVIFKPMEQSAAVGPVLRIMPFVGIDYNILPPSYCEA